MREEKKSFNPINAIGTGVKNVFNWFKKEKIDGIMLVEDEEENE